jgi:PPOX class probable F420-dependent enzyme
MPKPPLPPDLTELLARPNPSVMATLNANGAPVSVATWYLWEDGRVLVNLDGGRKRLAHLRSDPRVALTVLDAGDWYTHVSLRGLVASIEDDADLVDIDRISRHYRGRPYTNRERPRVSAWIDVEHWHAWNAG